MQAPQITSSIGTRSSGTKWVFGEIENVNKQQTTATKTITNGDGPQSNDEWASAMTGSGRTETLSP